MKRFICIMALMVSCFITTSYATTFSNVNMTSNITGKLSTNSPTAETLVSGKQYISSNPYYEYAYTLQQTTLLDSYCRFNFRTDIGSFSSNSWNYDYGNSSSWMQMTDSQRDAKATEYSNSALHQALYTLSSTLYSRIYCRIATSTFTVMLGNTQITAWTIPSDGTLIFNNCKFNAPNRHLRIGYSASSNIRNIGNAGYNHYTNPVRVYIPNIWGNSLTLEYQLQEENPTDSTCSVGSIESLSFPLNFC